MKPGSERRRDRDSGERGGDGGAWVAMAACVLVAMVIGVVEILAIVQIIQAGPVVGDILAFHASGAGIDQEPIAVAYAAQSADRPTAERTCVLSPRVMRAAGGSMVVEEREDAARVYRVHWAGTRTTEGPDDCGGQADLRISANDLRALASASGQLGPDGRIAARF